MNSLRKELEEFEKDRKNLLFDDFSKWNSLRKELEISGTNRKNFFDMVNNLDTFLKGSQKQYLETHKQMNLFTTAFSATFSNYFKEIQDTTQRINDFFNQRNFAQILSDNIKNLHKTWEDAIGNFMQPQISLSKMIIEQQQEQLKTALYSFQSNFKLSLIDTSYRISIAERFIDNIDFKKMYEPYQNLKIEMPDLKSTCFNIITNFSKIFESYKNAEDYFKPPSFLIPDGSIEILTNSYALYSLSEEVEDIEEESLIENISEIKNVNSLLAKVDPVLLNLYNGAWFAFRNKNPDRIRHILTSLRDLWTHIIQKLAPTEETKKWLLDRDKKYIDNGKPTRNGRILYICKNIAQENFQDFIISDVESVKRYMEYLNKVHELRHNLTDKQLHALLIRSDSHLLYILNIWNENN